MFKNGWFVETNPGLAGPFSISKIIEGLVDGHYHVTTRVSLDKINWKAICNQPIIEEYLQTLLKENKASVSMGRDGAGTTKRLAQENTGSFDLKKMKAGINEQLQEAQRLAQLNVSSSVLRKILSEITNKKKVQKTIELKSQPTLHADDENEIEIIHGKEPIYKTRSNKKLLYIVAPLLLFFAIHFSIVKVMEIRDRREREATVAQQKQAADAAIAGNYDKAIQIFSEIKNADLVSGQEAMKLVESLVENKKFADAVKVIEKIPTAELTPPNLANLNYLKGMAHSNLNQNQQAIEAYKVSMTSGKSYKILHNLAMAHLENGNPQAAEPLLLEALQLSEPDHGSTLVGLTEAAILLDQKEKRFERTEKAILLLEEYTKNPKDFLDEVVASKILAMWARNDNRLKQEIRNFANLNPNRGPRNLNYSLDYKRSQWGNLYLRGLDVVKSNPRDPYFNSFIAGCLARFTNLSSALPYAKYAFSTSKDLEFAGSYAYLLAQTGDTAQAKTILSTRFQKGFDNNLARAALTVICGENNPDCESGIVAPLNQETKTTTRSLAKKKPSFPTRLPAKARGPR